ncbi:MAG: tetratricopeptide repeat protein, partial [Halofilum sp. (in: g-proteobacteria)]
AEGEVRKSEPDIAPEERARRLEGKAREALDEGDLTTARDHLTKALEFDAERHSARDLLVGLSLRRGDTEAARNLLAEGVERAPKRSAYAKPYARLLVDAGDAERALAVLRRAAPADDRDAEYHGFTAAVAQRLKRHDLAASEYTRALEIDSSRGVWWMGLGISLRATDHPDEALAAFREARESGDLNERLDRWVQERIDALAAARE